MNRPVSIRQASAGFIAAGAVLIAAAAAPADAQEPAQGARQSAPAATQLPNFVGTSYNMPPDGLVVLRRFFEPGARTSWHAHKGAFLFFVEEGVGRVQIEGEPMRELKKGETHLTPPGVMHWHGAGAREPLTQVGVGFAEGITFAEAVTDAPFNDRE